jgi:hypothetical protein
VQTTPHALLAVGADLRIFDFEFGLVGRQRGGVRVIVGMVFGGEKGGEVLDEQRLV